VQSALKVSANASLWDKATRLREILEVELGGAAALDRVLGCAREEAADSEAGLAGLLGERSELLLPVVHTLVELEECLECFDFTA
jgi:hypothetical protein